MGVYNRGKYLFASGGIVWGTTDVRWMLVSGSYTPAATHDVVSDVVTNEIVATGYARQTQGGTQSVTEDDTNNRAELTHGDVTFAITQSGVAYRYAIRYKHNTLDTAAELIDYFDLTARTTDGGSVVLRPGADGSLQIL